MMEIHEDWVRGGHDSTKHLGEALRITPPTYIPCHICERPTESEWKFICKDCIVALRKVVGLFKE